MDFTSLKKEFSRQLLEVDHQNKLDVLRSNYLGKKGKLKKFFQDIANLSVEQKKQVGQQINELKNYLSEQLEQKKQEIILREINLQDQHDKIDVSLTSKKQVGANHPLEVIRSEVLQFFNQIGFMTVEGDEIEEDYYNFTALNIPEGHPARDSQDSFYLSNGKMLRTQTSPIQIRVMQNLKPPIAIVSPGRVFRRDTVDASHSPIFHQIEGLYVNEDVTFSDLKGILTKFCHSIFGDRKIRFRPDYFPFTEPSSEISIYYPEIVGGDGWLEILGAGIVNPLVLQNVGIDDKKYSGFAFGVGIERIAMLKYGIEDIRLFYQNDLEFLKQF